MEWNAETLEFLCQCFLNTLSPLPEPRRQAERALSEASDKPFYGVTVLRLVAEISIDEHISHSAAVHFKNHLKSRWVPLKNPNDVNQTLIPIMDDEKEEIKSRIVTLMLNSSPKIQSQLSEALSVIGKHDFPRAWPSLLPEICVTLDRCSQGNDYVSVNGVLATVNSLFKKFRYQFKTNELVKDLKSCLDSFAAPLLEVFKRTAMLLDQVVVSGSATAAILKPYIECQRLCSRIFYSLNFMDLPEFFEVHMEEWMCEFGKYLTVEYYALEGSKDGLALVDGLRAAVCENISLYVEKEEEPFQPYVGDFVQAVCNLLVAASASSSREQLTVTAIRFLTRVSTSVYHSLFAPDDILQLLCQSIVIPNVMLRDEDDELFEMNYIEFIRRDMEGSDLDTRRRIACELLKGIALHYKDQVTDKVSAQIHNCLGLFAVNPAGNWKHKDCAIYLIVSLGTKKAGGSSVSTDLVDFERFFESVIVPELQSQDVNAFPMLKAAALKFFTMFRNQISKRVAMELLPLVIRFLTSDSNVVHSYAASCIEKLLLVKDEGARARYSAGDIGPFLRNLMDSLFSALQKPESEENQYVMKCIMRVLGVSDIPREVALTCTRSQITVLNRVCENPKSPIFNHYLFESVAVLIRRATGTDPSLISEFESCLFHSFEMIFSKEISEFLPYAFQLLAQLVELNRPPLLQKYIQVFQILLQPNTWEKSAIVPALVRLLQAFLRKAPHELNQQGRLSEVLRIFDILVSLPSTDEQGFYVLNTMIENLGYDAISCYASHIWVPLFRRLQFNRTVKFIKYLLVFMSLFLIKYGSQNLVKSMNEVQQDVFWTVLEQFWVPYLKLIAGSLEMKLTSVASAMLIFESPTLLDSNLRGKMLDSCVTLLSRSEEERVEEEPEVPDFCETVGYSSSFVHLYNAGKKEEDPLKDIHDPKQFFVASLANHSAVSPGTYPQLINEKLEPTNQAALLQLCSSYNVSIV